MGKYLMLCMFFKVTKYHSNNGMDSEIGRFVKIFELSKMLLDCNFVDRGRCIAAPKISHLSKSTHELMVCGSYVVTQVNQE